MSPDKAENKHTLGIHIGVSFLDISYNDIKRRYYIPKEGIRNAISQFLSSHPLNNNSQAYIALEYLKKLFHLRLGGSVAQIITKGMENWHQLQNNCQVSSLFNQEFVFSVNERISSHGEVQKPLSLEELSAIEEKMKAKEIKRIAIHFLHADKFPIHQKIAAEYFANKGFEIYIPDEKTEDELAKWRTNALNASINGTFQEIKKEIIESLGEKISQERIHFLGTDDKKLTANCLAKSDLFFSSLNCRAEFLHLKSISKATFLGIDHFETIESDTYQTQWDSPWGEMNIPHPVTTELNIQPLSEIELNFFNELDFSKTALPSEPGPMIFGRGLKPTLIDIWAKEIKGSGITCLSDRVQDSQLNKIASQILAFSKSSKLSGYDSENLMKELKQYSLIKITAEIAKHQYSEKEKYIFGPLACVLYPEILKIIPNCKLISDDFAESNFLSEVH